MSFELDLLHMDINLHAFAHISLARQMYYDDDDNNNNNNNFFRNSLHICEIFHVESVSISGGMKFQIVHLVENIFTLKHLCTITSYGHDF